ncbi:Lipase, class 3 [Corchorus olitorius]|uniref:Lipase, class 3 n=1 Tax=Corchorus olitorius TaxID=93759 RepID=A0A1R3JN76_9ROSI|nr:Lipase, class 3 [Corchorus olitorius]
MACGGEDFSIYGPLHLTNVDWNNEHHRRSVAASLAYGVYILESDRQRKCRRSQLLAPPWWEFFHFKLLRQLADDDDDDQFTIFGAIFEYKKRSNSFDQSPHYVVAFRGTLMEPESFVRDLELDVSIILNGLRKTNRFRIAMKAVQDIIDLIGDCSKVWLTGHSLGAAMAILAGKNMAKKGKFLEGFLFNPPFISVPIERIFKNKKLNHRIRFAGSVFTAGLAITSALKGDEGFQDNNNWFSAISGWIPWVFVNRVDYVCSEYIGYYEHRKKMDEIGFGAGAIAKLAARYSLGGFAMSMVGIKGVEIEEPMHLLPSANLIVNLNPPLKFWQAHGLCQWWRPDLNLKCTVYKYK